MLASSMHRPVAAARMVNWRILAGTDGIPDGNDKLHGRRTDAYLSPQAVITNNFNATTTAANESVFDVTIANNSLTTVSVLQPAAAENFTTVTYDNDDTLFHTSEIKASGFMLDDEVMMDDNLQIEVAAVTPPPSRSPTRMPTRQPTRTPTRTPTRSPTRKPSNPTRKPTAKPTMDSGCVSFSTYDAIDNDIAALKNNIADAKSRSHFLGGIVRLAAHDFMDYNKNDSSNPMGPDGCFDAEHAANNGLPSIWCTNCPLTLLYQQKYSHISKADFWIASANAVIRQTSVNNALDLKSTFKWGRKDAALCAGSGTRLPTTSGCTSVENVFLTRMGLGWRDAAVLMGAHTLGRGNSAVRKLLSI